MEANENVVIEGLEVIIERDLQKHRGILERTRQELLAYTAARSHEIAKKKRWRKLIGGGKYNDDALRASMVQSAVNVRHLSDKIDAAVEKIKFETNIVDTLAQQQKDQTRGLEALARYKVEHAT